MRHLLLLLTFILVGFLYACSSSSDGDETSTNIDISFEALSDSVGAALVTPSDHCVEAPENNNGAETQFCSATPENYDLGILAIYLVECLDATLNYVACGSEDFDAISSRTALYNGVQVDVTIDEDGDNFEEELNAISDTLNVGGIQVVTAYIQQKFPSLGEEANKIMDELRGKTYRICITEEDEVSESTMATRCGQSDARRGDYLVDLNDDGVFGFISTEDDEISEATTRPTDYNDFNDENFDNENVCFGSSEEGGSCENEYTSTSFYGTAGYFAPLMSLQSVEEITSESLLDLLVTFDITDTFQWTDGADGPIADPDTCVDAISTEDCDPDSDPDSVGIYNIFRDTAFLPQTPEIQAGSVE